MPGPNSSVSAPAASAATATELATNAVTTALNIATGAAARTITMGNDTGATSLVLNCGTGALNIGQNAIARTITIGNITLASALVLKSGTGGITLDSTGTGDITLTSTDKLILDCADVLELNSSGGAISIGNDDVSQDINIGTQGERTISIGNQTSGSQVDIKSGTGGIQLTTTGSGRITFTSNLNTSDPTQAGQLYTQTKSDIDSFGPMDTQTFLFISNG